MQFDIVLSLSFEYSPVAYLNVDILYFHYKTIQQKRSALYLFDKYLIYYSLFKHTSFRRTL